MKNKLLGAQCTHVKREMLADCVASGEARMLADCAAVKDSNCSSHNLKLRFA